MYLIGFDDKAIFIQRVNFIIHSSQQCGVAFYIVSVIVSSISMVSTPTTKPRFFFDPSENQCIITNNLYKKDALDKENISLLSHSDNNC